jgi:predicted TIM-barrel enzyme
LLEKVQEAVKAAGRVPVWVASGVAADNATEYLEAGARGLIVGTSIKRGGHAEAAVDRLRARELARRVRAFRDAGASAGKSVTGKPVTGKPAAGRARTRS